MRAVRLLFALGVTGIPTSAPGALVTWTWSGVASTSGSVPEFTDGSAYTASLTFDSNAVPTSSLGYSSTRYTFAGAIVSATFESASYNPSIPVTPYGTAWIEDFYFTLRAGASGSQQATPELPWFLMDVDNVLFDDPTHLPVGSPPWGQAQYARYEYADFTLYLGGSNAINESTFPVSSIQVTVPEPAAAGAILLSLCALALLRERELIRRIAGAGRHRSA